MAVEAKRGCGYRKVGGTYLVGGGIGAPCDRLPFALEVCPCCNAGFKPSLGWTWIRPGLLFQGPHIFEIGEYPDPASEAILCSEAEDSSCWLCANPGKFERAGLIWIGERFYKSPSDFIKEGVELGFSRRIKAVPQKFKVGETPIFLAHKKAVPVPVQNTADYLIGTIEKPGIFYVWIPQFVEKIFKESDRESDVVKDAVKGGIRPVFVPDNYKDHQGTLYDKDEEHDNNAGEN